MEGLSRRHTPTLPIAGYQESSGWARSAPSSLPLSCRRLRGWPGFSPLRATLPPILPGPVPWERVPAGLDRLPAQLRVSPRPAVPGRPLCGPCPVPMPVPAQSHGSVLPSPLLTGPLAHARRLPLCSRGQPGLQDGCGPPGCSNTAGLSPRTPRSPGLVQVRASIPMSKTQGPTGWRLMGREVGGSGLGEGIGGHAELPGVPPHSCALRDP